MNAATLSIRAFTADDLATYRAVRLRALREDPIAFGSTHVREAAFNDATWTQRLMRSVTGDMAGRFAFLGVDCVGLIGGVRVAARPHEVALLSMWVAPEARRLGAGRGLVDSVAAWARRQGGVTTLTLQVTDVNAGAIAFYERLGFVDTGEREPYPNAPGVTEWRMTRPLGAAAG